ncbi:helix-turn-helix transcriptional regulator [Nostoc ellipsosporum NOK]|nr:helix-turn-helix transcriptional regulator [Nostoc ellipsosporum NOK]
MRDFLFTLILLGSVQGVIICCLLLFSKGRRLFNRLLATIILLFSLPGFHLYLHYRNAYELNSATQLLHDIIPMVIVMPIGPLIWFYIQSLTNPEFRLTKKDYLHFIPVVIDLLPKLAAIAFYVSLLAGNPITSRESLAGWDNWYNQYADIPRWISLSLYLIWSLRYFSSRTGIIGTKTRRWIKTFLWVLITFQLIWLLYLVPYIIPISSDKLLDTLDWFPVYIPMTVLVYWLGIQGFLESRQISVPVKNRDRQWIDDAWQRLCESMEKNKLFLDPSLNLEKLAAYTGIPSRQVSQLLNQHRATNFNGFINFYRVEEFKSRFLDPAYHQFTINGLAMDCGFNSPATFQRLFRQLMGMTPTAFRQAASGQSGTGNS